MTEDTTPSVRLTVQDSLDTPDAHFVRDALAGEIAARFGPREETPLVVFARDDAGKPIGGVVGVTHWRWLYIRNLWIAPAFRARGFGRRLLEAAETQARMRACVGAYLDTFDPEAERFYLRCGYAPFGRLDNFPPGHTRRFLAKPFAD